MSTRATEQFLLWCAIISVLQNLHSSPSKALLFLTYLSNLPSSAIVPYRHAITSTFHLLLDPPTVSRRVQALYVTIWTKINTVTPRKYVCPLYLFFELCAYHLVDESDNYDRETYISPMYQCDIGICILNFDVRI